MKTLWTWLVELDRILRGETTRMAELQGGTLRMPLFGITFVLVMLGMLYGICMGCYALINTGYGDQMLANLVKVPALFVLTLAVTLPSLYVFNALAGSRLSLGAVVKLFIAALAVNLAVLSSLGPIVAFFSINTDSYNFMVLLNVLVFAVAGVLSMGFLLQTLRRLNIAPIVAEAVEPVRRERPFVTSAGAGDPLSEGPQPSAAPQASTSSTTPDTAAGNLAGIEASAAAGLSFEAPVVERAEPGPLEHLPGDTKGRHVRTVFVVWIVVFALVGAQMSWVLRPFIGSPDMQFEWFRPRDSNFFQAVWRALHSLLS